MKKFVIIAFAMVLAAGMARAQTTINKANNTTALNVGGSWTGGTAPTGVDTACWGATVAGANSSALGGNVIWGQIQITNPGGAITIANTAGATLTLNGVSGTGIDMSTASQNLTIDNSITLGGTQAWTVASRTLKINSFVATAGYTLTLSGPGQVNFPTTSTGITGSGSVIVDRVYLNLISGGNQAANSYTGTTTVQNGGGIMHYANNIPSGNVILNGGVLDGYYNAGFARTVGTGNNQIQITGGASGFGCNGNCTIALGNVTWGTATFNPSSLVLGTPSSSAGTTTFSGGIDLNGATRTVLANSSVNAGAISGVISNSAGMAGLVKTGAGTLTLSGANTYNGKTVISNGILRANNLTALGSGPVGITNAVLSLAQSLTISHLEGNVGAIIDLGAGGAVLTVNQSSTNSFAGAITNSGSFTKSGAGTLTLSGTNTYSGATTINGGTLLGEAGGSCASSAVTVTNTFGNTSTFGVSVTNNTMQWTCASLTFITNGVGAQLKFSFAVQPSTTLAPLNITGDLNFNGVPLVVVELAGQVLGRTYPLLTVGALAPSEVPVLSGTIGILAWGGVGGKTLSLTTPSAGTVITIR